MRSSVFIKTFAPDLHWLEWCLRFLNKNWKGTSEFVICAPNDCSDRIKAMESILGHDISLAPMEQWENGYTHQQYMKMQADVYCSGEYISFIDSDAMLVRPTDFDTELMIGDKSVMWYTEYSKIPGVGWYHLVEQVLGMQPEYEFMRSFPITYHRSTISSCRAEIEAKHGMSLYDFMSSVRSWSEFNIMGFFAFVFQRHLYEWKNTWECPMHEHDAYRHDRVRQWHNRQDEQLCTDEFLQALFDKSCGIEPTIVPVKTEEPVPIAKPVQIAETPAIKKVEHKDKIRIGVIDQSIEGWSAGANFTRMMLGCMELAITGASDVLFLSRSKQHDFTTVFPSVFINEHPTDGYEELSKWKDVIADTRAQILIPIRDSTVDDIGDTPFVGWIPDFQHERLPAFFDKNDIIRRQQILGSIVSRARLVLLSSESVCNDFKGLYPECAFKARVAKFPSLLWMSNAAHESVVSEYNLPRRFALVSNQWWRHKNHHILPTALGILKRCNVDIDIVLTGLPVDYRDKENKCISTFFQECAKENVSDRIHFLGEVPYPHLVSLMREATLIIQPSFFEGWSTSIEDAKALGRPMICSDIPVHREQVPDALGFFDPYKPKDLASLIDKIYASLPTGPDRVKEEAASEINKSRAMEYGKTILDICHEALDG